MSVTSTNQPVRQLEPRVDRQWLGKLAHLYAASILLKRERRPGTQRSERRRPMTATVGTRHRRSHTGPSSRTGPDYHLDRWRTSAGRLVRTSGEGPADGIAVGPAGQLTQATCTPQLQRASRLACYRRSMVILEPSIDR